MKKCTSRGSFHLRVKEVAQRQGIDPTGLANASGLPLSKVQELWDHPTRDQDLNTLVPVARTLKASLGEVVEILNGDSSEVIRNGTPQQATDRAI